MENEININTPAESVIAAYGTSSSHRLLPLFLGFGALILSVFLLLGVLWLFKAPFLLPDQTTFLGIASPRTLQEQLSAETRSALPEVWRLQTESGSRWPIIFGAFREGDTWHFFTIGPRWSLKTRAGLETKRARATAFVTSHTSTSSQEAITYLSWWGKTLRHPRALGQLEIRPFIVNQRFFEPDDSLQGIIYRDRFVTNLSPLPIYTRDLQNVGDTFLRFPAQATSTARAALLQSLDLSDELSLTNLAPDTLNLRYNASGTISHLQFTTPNVMSSSTKLSLLGALGFSKKVITALPDGSLLAERQLPNEEELRTTLSYTTPAGILELTDTSFQLQQGATSTPAQIPFCQPGTLLGRFSPQALERLRTALDLHFLANTRGLQISQDAKRISACLE